MVRACAARERTTLGIRKKSKWVVILVIVVAVAAGGVAWLAWPKLPHIQVATITRKDMNYTIFASGTVKPTQRQLVMQSALPGTVESIDVNVGQSVHSGQVLLTCQHAVQAAALSQAQTQLGDTEVQYHDALQQYLAAPVLGRSQSKAALDAARTNLHQAQAAVSQAKAAYDILFIHAQMSGQVILVNPEGLDPASGTPAPYVELVSGQKQLVTTVSEVDAVRLHPGMMASISCDAFPGQTWQAQISHIADYATTGQDGTGQVQVTLGDLPNHFPVPLDYQVNLSIVSATHHDALVVPYSSLVQTGTQYSVYTVANGIIHIQAVALGATSNQFVEVTKGLRAGQQIVVNPPAGLQNGQAVIAT